MDRLKTLAQDVINGSWQLQLAATAFACMALIMVFTLLSQVGDFTRYVQSDDEVSEELQINNTVPGTKVVNQIVQSPIFGTYIEQKVEKINTSLDLLGIMMATDPQLRRAFIAEPNKDSFVYREGDELSTGLKVHRIYPDKVLLLRYGKPETLYIAWEQGLEEGQFIKPKARTNATKRPTTKARAKSRSRSPQFNREDYMEKMRDRLGKYGRDIPNLKQFQRGGNRF